MYRNIPYLLYNKCHKFFAIAIVLIFQIAPSYSQLNIDSCQQKAKANFPLIKQYDLIAKSTEYTLSNANKAYLPQVSLQGIGAYFIKGLPSLSSPGQEPAEKQNLQFIGIAQLNQTIWDGGATRSQKEIVKANAAVEIANVDVALYNIRQRVNQLYFGILVIDEQQKQLDVLYTNLKRNLNKVVLSKENGLAYQTDVDEVKAEILNIEQKKIEYSYARIGYLEMLSFIIGEQLSQKATLEKPVVIEQITTLANNRPELGLYAMQQNLLAAKSSADKVYNMPKIGLLGAGVLIEPGITFGPSSINSLALAGLSISWNTAGIYKINNNKKLDKIQAAKINNQQETFLFNNNFELKQASSEIEKQKAIIEKDDEIVVLKSNIQKSTQLKYDNGMCSMNDLINAMSKETEARSNQALHNVQLLISMYNYKTISGN